VRRLLICLLSVSLSAAACSSSNPAAPSPLSGGSLDAKAEKPANVNGVVSEFGGTASDFHFMVEGTPVWGDGDTGFYGESIFEHLADGVRVEVKGVLWPDHVYAKRIHVNSREVSGPSDSSDTGGGEEPPPPPAPAWCSMPTNDGPSGPFPTAEKFGEIYLSSTSGTEPDLVLNTISTYRVVTTSAATIVRRNNDLLPLSILRPRLVLELFGTVTATAIDVAEINLSRSALDVFAEGQFSELIAGDTEVRFVVGTTSFLANEWTKFSGSPCEVLVEGATLRLRGVRMADGVTALATYIELITP